MLKPAVFTGPVGAMLCTPFIILRLIEFPIRHTHAEASSIGGTIAASAKVISQ